MTKNTKNAPESAQTNAPDAFDLDAALSAALALCASECTDSPSKRKGSASNLTRRYVLANGPEGLSLVVDYTRPWTDAERKNASSYTKNMTPQERATYPGPFGNHSIYLILRNDEELWNPSQDAASAPLLVGKGDLATVGNVATVQTAIMREWITRARVPMTVTPFATLKGLLAR